RKRIGRGQGSGFGGTAGRGHKGAQSRSGYKSKRGFEGGQMPLQRRVPKRGFNSPNGTVYTVINLSQLQKLSEKNNITDFDINTLRALKIVCKSEVLKVLGVGSLNTVINVEAHAFSAKAKAEIEAKGGNATVI
ncbi:MAG TPA: 50S ribosomal protein L15, partial [Chitinophagales bacterium]|nr:50S ribosomal protein L15 [Chitinophagales bacterium]